MGMFLSMSGIVGKSRQEVQQALHQYATTAGGGLTPASIHNDHENFCVIDEVAGNTVVFYPFGYLEWEQSSEFLSNALNAPVFSFHIHDGDLWMYVLYLQGEAVDQFNPIPEYWDDQMSEEEADLWKGNPALLCNYVPDLTSASIERYLVRWDEDAEPLKAYEDDEFAQEDWQLVDFMRKLGFRYPLNDAGTPLGRTYQLWTAELKHQGATGAQSDTSPEQEKSKPWWKLW